MDITFSSSDELDKQGHVALHMFYYLFDYDFRRGVFADDASIRHLGMTMGLSSQQIEEVADEYERTQDNTLSYQDSQKRYNRLLANAWETELSLKLKKYYNVIYDPKKSLILDLVYQVRKANPDKKWVEENVFLMKKLDVRAEKEVQEKLNQKQVALKDEKIVKFPVKKKLSEEEILKGTNFYLMMTQLDMPMDKAMKLADDNYKEKTKNKVFEPYRPSQKPKP